jgi:hypothetical protein
VIARPDPFGAGEALSVRQVVLGDVVPAFGRLRQQGKTRFLGLTAIGDTLHANPNDCRATQRGPTRLIASDSVPTKTRLKAQLASRLNQLHDTNLRPR